MYLYKMVIKYKIRNMFNKTIINKCRTMELYLLIDLK